MITFSTGPNKIVRTKNIDNGTTLGKTVYVDDIGGQWVEASSIDVQSTGYCGITINKKGEFINSFPT